MALAEAWLQLGARLADGDAGVRLAEELLWVRDKTGRLVRLRANAAQRLLEERRGRRNIVLKARQMGLSTWVVGRFLLKTMLVPGTVTVLVSHTQESGEALFRGAVRMWENLPTEMRDGPARQGRANARQMTFPVVDSEFRVESASDRNAGRGLTITNLHCSEVARWPGDAADVLAGLQAALVPHGEVVLESTPCGAYGAFFAEWMAAEENGVAQHFMPWWMEPGYVSSPVAEMTAEEMALSAREGLSAEQIGFRRGLERRFGALRSQEFAEDAVSCFRASGACYFEVGAVERALQDVCEPVEMRRDGALMVWLPAVVGRRYLIAVDPAGGGSAGDYAAAQVVDVATGLQCAELRARLSPRDLAHVVAQLAGEYGGAGVAVERNNHGAAVLAYLERESCSVLAGRDGLPGWLTDAASRPAMLSELAVLLTERPELFASARLLGECRSFVVDARGRASAAVGAHDDLVMSVALAHWVRAGLRG